MIDFMLKNSCVPSGRLDVLGISAVVKAFDQHATVTWNEGKISRQAETTFEKFRDWPIVRVVNSRIDDHVERDRPPFSKR